MKILSHFFSTFQFIFFQQRTQFWKPLVMRKQFATIILRVLENSLKFISMQR